MKIVLKILGIIALIVWEVAFIVNFTTYDTAEQVMCVVLMVIPFPIALLVKKKRLKRDNAIYEQKKKITENAKDSTVEAKKNLRQNKQEKIKWRFSTEKKNNISSYSKKKYPKCNCDGCNRQETCTYGHIIYDDFDHSRLSLVDKFIMVYTFDSEQFEPKDDYSNIATLEERHDQNKLLRLDRDTLVKTLNYLQEQKKLYLDAGKCGRAYFNNMNLGGEIQLVKNSIKLMDEITPPSKKTS